MNDQRSDSSHHCSSGDNDDNGEPARKCQRVDNVEAPEPRSITNICYDVLERIFEFLDIESLLNVANTCKRLQIAAAVKFGDEYDKKAIRLEIEGQNQITVNQYFISVCGLKFCLPFLRCFGATLTHLGVTSINNDYVDQYINKYCANTLKKIRFTEKTSLSAENFPLPFPKVKDVRIIRSDLGKHLPLISQFFPNLI